MSQFNVNDIEIASHLDDMRPSSTHAELRIGKGNTFVNVSPEMGGMVTRFQSSVRGQIQDLLHFEPFDFDHSGKKPKVGIPVLLPFA
jgi:hypothetical protein